MQAGNVRTTASYWLARAAGRVPGLAWRRYRLVATPVAGMPARLPAGWRVAAGPECPPALCPPPAARFRTAQGAVCLTVAPPAGEAVGALWLTAGPFDEDEAHLRFEPPTGWAWDTGLYIAPSARGGRAFAALWAAASELVGSMSRIADYAAPVLAAHARMGAHDLGAVATLCVGRHVRVWGAAPSRAALDGPRAIVRLPAP
jgi:hypothetical protein